MKLGSCCWVIAGLIGITAVGCGEATSANENTAVVKALKQPRKCLLNVGASLANTSTEVNFARGQMDKPAGAGNGIADVSQYSPAYTSSPHPPYVLWVGGPAAETEPDLHAVADDSRQDTFVLYLRSPRPRALRNAGRCLDAFAARDEPPDQSTNPPLRTYLSFSISRNALTRQYGSTRISAGFNAPDTSTARHEGICWSSWADAFDASVE
jgi:hypothetical protein